MGIEPFLTASAVTLRGGPAPRAAAVLRVQGAVHADEAALERVGFPFEPGSRPSCTGRAAARSATASATRAAWACTRSWRCPRVIERLTVETPSADEIKRQAIAEGMLTLRDDGFAKVSWGTPPSRRSCASSSERRHVNHLRFPARLRRSVVPTSTVVRVWLCPPPGGLAGCGRARSARFPGPSGGAPAWLTTQSATSSSVMRTTTWSTRTRIRRAAGGDSAGAARCPEVAPSDDSRASRFRARARPLLLSQRQAAARGRDAAQARARMSRSPAGRSGWPSALDS